MSAPRATLRLTLSCNNRCVFCAQLGLPSDAGQPESLGRLREELLRLRSHGDEITLVGGEPTLSPDLVAVVAHARELGFSGIGLQSNGRLLAREGFAGELLDAGLTDVHVSLHGAEAAVHDYHTGADGSFEELLAGVAACRARGLAVVATTVLTRSNFRSLARLPWLLASRGVAAWAIAVPHARGRAARAPALHRVPPRLGVALPYALHALASADKLDLPSCIRGAPLCLLGPYAARALPSPKTAFDDRCAACAARSRCPGLDPAYLRRFGADEITALATPPPSAETGAGLERLFPGTGELGALPDLDALPPPPSAAGERRPTLAKARPAPSEPRSGA